MSVSATLARAAAELSDAGVASPRVDAELLAAHVLGTSRGRLVIAADFTEAQLAEFTALVAARRTRVPLQYLTGHAAFRHLELAVGPGVFVPRPETELLVDWGLRWLRSGPDTPVVVDLCAGSGAIALAVATENMNTRVYAVERDPAALTWLRRNVSTFLTGEHAVTVVAGDVTAAATATDLDGTVDLVLCNPPYVPEAGGGALPTEVLTHDPYQAVFSGLDGLDLIRPLIGRVATLLRPGGAFGVEHDDSHGESVPALLRADGRFVDVTAHLDLAGRPRFTTATTTAFAAATTTAFAAEHTAADRWQDGSP